MCALPVGYVTAKRRSNKDTTRNSSLTFVLLRACLFQNNFEPIGLGRNESNARGRLLGWGGVAARGGSSLGSGSKARRLKPIFPGSGSAQARRSRLKKLMSLD